jgi:hypothetical protein
MCSFITPRSNANTSARELLYVGFLAALPATLIALFNLGAVYGHASWGLPRGRPPSLEVRSTKY